MVPKPSAEEFCLQLIVKISKLVCISGPSTVREALMRGKFVLAKHCQIYEAAELSSSALTTVINIKTLQGLHHMGNQDLPNMNMCCAFTVNQHKQCIIQIMLVWFNLHWKGLLFNIAVVSVMCRHGPVGMPRKVVTGGNIWFMYRLLS